MPETTGIVRACSSGNVTIETAGGSYCLSREEIRDILVFGRRIPLRQHNGIIDGDAIAYSTPSGKGIIICLASVAYLVPRDSFVLVASGAADSTPLAIILRG